MNNKLQSKVAVALLTTMLATGAAPVFAANNNNGRIDNFYINKNSSKMVEEQPGKFARDEENRTARFYELSNGQKQADIKYLSSGKDFFRHGDYINEYLSGNYRSVSEVLDALDVVKTDELKQYSGKFYKLNQAGTNNFNYTKIADPFDGSVDPVDPEVPTDPTLPGGQWKAVHVDMLVDESLAMLNEQNRNLIKDYNQARDNVANQEIVIKDLQKEYKIAAENKDAKAIWQVLTKGKAQAEYDAKKDKLNIEKQKLKKLYKNYKEIKEVYDVFENEFEGKAVEAKMQYDKLDKAEQAKVKNVIALNQNSLRVNVNRANELITGFISDDIDIKTPEEEILCKAISAGEAFVDSNDLKGIKDKNEQLVETMRKTSYDSVKRMTSKGASALRKEDRKQIDAIEEYYNKLLKDGVSLKDLDYYYAYTDAKRLFELQFAPFRATVTTPTAETIKWFERLRAEIPLAKKWIPDLSHDTRDDWEVNGLQAVEDEAVVGVPIKIEAPESIKSDNIVYFLFNWQPNDSNIRNGYYHTQLSNPNQLNEIYMNYSIQGILNLDWVTNLKEGQDENNLNDTDDSYEEKSNGFLGNLI